MRHCKDGSLAVGCSAADEQITSVLWDLPSVAAPAIMGDARSVQHRCWIA